MGLGDRAGFFLDKVVRIALGSSLTIDNYEHCPEKNDHFLQTHGTSGRNTD
jgi:hypothetical protein